MTKNETVTTHKSTTPNNEMSNVDKFRTKLHGTYFKQITNYFDRNEDEAIKFMSAVVHSIQTTPDLLACNTESLMTAFMACAEYRLYPSSVSGEAYVIPYGGKAQFQLGYQGLITLLYRAGVESINTSIVYENDDFEYEEGIAPKLYHKPNVFGDRGKPIGVYAVANVNGQKVFKIMSKDDVMKFKGLAQAGGSKHSPWNSNKDPELHMWRKTAIKQLAKTLPKNETLAKALDTDNESSVVAKDKRNLNGPGVGKALHKPVDTSDEAEDDNNESDDK